MGRDGAFQPCKVHYGPLNFGRAQAIQGPEQALLTGVLGDIRLLVNASGKSLRSQTSALETTFGATLMWAGLHGAGVLGVPKGLSKEI